VVIFLFLFDLCLENHLFLHKRRKSEQFFVYIQQSFVPLRPNLTKSKFLKIYKKTKVCLKECQQ